MSATTTIEDMIACAERELALRRSAYPRWVTSGKMKAEAAEHELATMLVIRNVLVSMRDYDAPPTAWRPAKAAEFNLPHDPNKTLAQIDGDHLISFIEQRSGRAKLAMVTDGALASSIPETVYAIRRAPDPAPIPPKQGSLL